MLSQLQSDLSFIVDKISKMRLYFVFCVKPNLSMMPHYDVSCVQNQLESSSAGTPTTHGL